MTPGTASVAIIMAAGKGTRMQSELPKVLVSVCGRPMIDYVLESIEQAGISRSIVVVGYRSDLVKAHLQGRPHVEFAEQTPQLGTGHAVQMCQPLLADFQGPVVVLAGDSPMIQPSSLRHLLEEYHRGEPACILGTAHKQDPQGLGRIVRDAERRFLKIVEEKDATPAEKLLTEVNLSCYVFNSRQLFEALNAVRPQNAQGEYYLTDCPAIMLGRGQEVRAYDVLSPGEALSINNREELALVEEALQARAATVAPPHRASGN